MSRTYLLVSPCRNEARYMRRTLDSVVAQSVQPARWVVVDDGSTDDSAAILAEYARKHDWIHVVLRVDRGYRAVGSGVVDAFYAGYDTVDPKQYDYVGKLDMDLVLPGGYFEELMRRMESDPRLATCSGKSYIRDRDELVSERHGDETSIGATKFYRRDRFEQIGGFVRGLMWDGIDVHRCRMMGWDARSWDDRELRFLHLRPQGTSERGALTGRMRHGRGQYFMGTTPVYMIASAVYRFGERPYVIAGLAMLWGYVWSAVRRRRRYPDREFRRFLRRWQWRALLTGKRRAVEAALRQRGASASSVPSANGTR